MGADFIQVREKDLSDRKLFGLVRSVVAAAHPMGCRVLVNGRADIALAAGADGVHLPSTGLRPRSVRSWVPPGFVVGLSVHSRGEALRAEREGADYVLAGPVYPTPSKLKYGKPLGLRRFARICRSVRIPVYALGGVHARNIGELRAAGAAGVAGITLFQREPCSLRSFDFSAPSSRGVPEGAVKKPAPGPGETVSE